MVEQEHVAHLGAFRFGVPASGAGFIPMTNGRPGKGHPTHDSASSSSSRGGATWSWRRSTAWLISRDRVGQVLPVGLALDRDPQGGDLPGQVLGLGQLAGVGLPVALDLHPVAVGLAVLGEEDHRRRVGRLGREGEVEEDERVRIPAEPGRGDVEGDPDDDQAGLDRQVAPGPEVAGHGLGPAAEAVRVVGRTAPGPARLAEIVAPRHGQLLAGVTRQPTGSTRSSTSSIVTAPSRRPASSTTGRATTS